MSLWKAIRMEMEVVCNGVVFVMGNGRRVRFWLDRLCGDEPLKYAFPSLMLFQSLRRLRWRRLGVVPLRGVVEHTFVEAFQQLGIGGGGDFSLEIARGEFIM